MNPTKTEENPFYQYIDTQKSLDHLIEQLRQQGDVALDTEADSFHHYQPKICLIQISFQDETFIVDPLAPINISALLDELKDKQLIIHDAGYDLRLLNADFNFKPNHSVFDTMLAATLASMEKVGLSDVLHHVTGVKVAKHHQRADWSKRPLAENLIRYAAEDTASLVQIKDYLANQLAQLGRTEWHIESCQHTVQAAYASKEPPDTDVQWRVKGAGKLSFKEMAFLREIWHWRETIAKRTNIAPFMICRNEEMVKLAQWAAKRKKTIDAESKFPIRHKSNKTKSLIEALRKAQSLEVDQWPGRRKSDPSKRLNQTTRNTVNRLKDECEQIAREYKLPLNLIASRSALTRIVLNEATTPEQILKRKILMNWQTNLLIPAIQKVLK